MPELEVRTQQYSGNDIQVAVRRGLGISSRDERDLLELNRDGLLPDMNSFLRARMPQLFNHLARDNQWIMTVDRSNWKDGDRHWPYVLLARNHNRTLVPVVLNGYIDPTVSDFRAHSGRINCPDAQRVIYIGGCFPVSGSSHQASRPANQQSTATVDEILPKTVGKWIRSQDLGASVFVSPRICFH